MYGFTRTFLLYIVQTQVKFYRTKVGKFSGRRTVRDQILHYKCIIIILILYFLNYIINCAIEKTFLG